jgi:hypothetical protein
MSLRGPKMEPKSNKMKPFGGLLATRRPQNVIWEFRERFKRAFSWNVVGSGQLLGPSGGRGAPQVAILSIDSRHKMVKRSSARGQ